MVNPDPHSQPAYEDVDPERAASAEPGLPVLQYEAQRRHDPYAALKVQEYRLYAASFVLAIVGGQIQSVALAWQVYQQTKSAMSLGFLGGIQVIPLFLLALPAGQLADVARRRRMLLVTQMMLVVWGLLLTVLTWRFASSPNLIPAIYGLIFLNAVTLTFARPARSSYLPQLVSPDVFTNAVTWQSSMFEISSMAGPAIGGFIVGHGGPAAAYLVNAVMLLACFSLTMQLPDTPPATSGKARASGFKALVAGVEFVWRTKLLLATMTLDLFAVLLGGAVYILPIFADRLGVGSVGYGFLRAAPSIGAFSMALVLAHRPPMKHAGKALLLAVAGFGLATVVFGLSNNFWLSLVMLAATGAFDNISVVIRHSLVQLLTPDAMRGRVSAVNQVFIGSSNELGGMESGLTAAWFGPVASVVAGGLGTVIVVLIAIWRWPQVARLGRLEDVKAGDGE